MSFYIRDKILQNYTNQKAGLGQNWKAKKALSLRTFLNFLSVNVHYVATKDKCLLVVLPYWSLPLSLHDRIHMHSIPSESYLPYATRISMEESLLDIV